MIVDPPIGKLLERVDCRYTLAVEASKRAREIIGGAKPLIETKDIPKEEQGSLHRLVEEIVAKPFGQAQ